MVSERVIIASVSYDHTGTPGNEWFEDPTPD